MSNKEQKCECNSVGAHHSDCPMSMCFFKKCDGDYKDKVITVPPDWKNKDMKRTIDNPYVVGVEDTKPELEIEEIIKNFEANFAEQYSPNDWKRLKGIRVQEPLQWLRENIYELLLTQRNELEREIEGMKMEIPPYSSNKTEFTFTDLIMKSGYNEALQDVLEVLKGKNK